MGPVRRLALILMAAASTLAADVKELEAVTWEMERRGLIAPDFGAWLESNVPRTVEMQAKADWTGRHFRVMQDVLNRVTSGELKRVIFQVPIRHGKTEHNTYGYTAYNLARDPTFRGLVASYNQTKATDFSRYIRKLARQVGVSISQERDAASDWQTVEGGGIRAVGAGAGVASINADGIVIDDPVGKREDAESPAIRFQVYDWITNDILARAEPHTWVILTMSRWHQDDPVGRLLDQQADRWHVVDLPALAEENDALGRKEGEPLWPEFRSKEWLEDKRVEMGSYGFASLLQGRPRPRDGGMFKWDWWRTLEDAPRCSYLVRYWDLAGTQPEKGKHDPDFSAGTLMGRMDDGRNVILNQVAFRKSVAARDAEIERIAIADREAYGDRVKWWIETEAGIGGKERTEAIKRRVHGVGLVINDEPATGSKVTRAEPLESAVEAGNVVLGPDDPVKPWRDAFRLEAADFPHGTHDDRVDSAAGAYNKLVAGRPAHGTRILSPWG